VSAIKGDPSIERGFALLVIFIAVSAAIIAVVLLYK
jgi:hypothetical protein